MTNELAGLDRLILLGTGDAHPVDAAALREQSDRDIVKVSMAIASLQERGLLDADGYPTADGIRAAWS